MVEVPVFCLNLIFLTSQFFVLLYIWLVLGNYEGYGRKYRERLLGRWGIVDVDDCCSCAKFLVTEKYSTFVLIMWETMKFFNVKITWFGYTGRLWKS